MSVQFTFFETDRGLEPKVRNRFESGEPLIEFTITDNEVLKHLQMALHASSTKFYNGPDFWEAIADVNAVKPPWEWALGDVIFIPRDFLDAFAPRTQDEALARKIF